MNNLNSLIIAAAFLSITSVANAATDTNVNQAANIESASVSLGFKSSSVKRFNKFTVSVSKAEQLNVNESQQNVSAGFAPGFNSSATKRFNKVKISGKEAVQGAVKVETAYKAPKRFISRGFTLGSHS